MTSLMTVGTRGAILAALLLTALSAAEPASTEPAYSKADRKSPPHNGASLGPAWGPVSPEWIARLEQDEPMALCSAFRNKPPEDVAEQIKKREQARIIHPDDGQYMGDWRRGERLAQSGYGLRFTDYPPTQPNGGNCFACHQLDRTEVSSGTLGPSLVGYGKLHRGDSDAARMLYERIYNPQAQTACARMPRFGTHGVLTIEQIKDLVAYVMSPESPVNK